jgi:hypothetical protein
MRAGFVQHALSVRAPKSLAARGGLAHTFGGLAGFVVLTLLCGGFYILQDSFANPLTQGASAVLCAAIMITFAAILLFFLIKPGKRIRRTNLERRARDATASLQPAFNPAPEGTRKDHSRNNLPYQRVYVDHSCIRP